MDNIKAVRLMKELQILKTKPPWGISCSTIDNNSMDNLEVQMMGPRNTPYEDGMFHLHIELSAKYPFEPPNIKFVKPVLHPNLDPNGRVCMNWLKSSWRPSLTLDMLLVAIQTLLGSPNWDDPLMPDLVKEYKEDPEAYEKKIRKSVLQSHSQ